MYIKHIFATLLCFFFLFGGSHKTIAQQKSYEIPLAGNAFEIDYENGQSTVGRNSVIISSDSKSKTNTYFKVLGKGTIVVQLKGKSINTDKATVTVDFLGKKKKASFTTKEYKTVDLGSFEVSQEGYIHLDLFGGHGTADISHLVVSGTATEQGIIYANDPKYYYWARRGPSVIWATTLPLWMISHISTTSSLFRLVKIK